MSNNTNINENINITTLNNDGPIAHLDHMLNNLHNEPETTRIPSIDTFDNKHHQTSRITNITNRKIVEKSSENSIVYRYYTGESGPVIDEHFEKAFKQPVTLNSTRAIPTRDLRTSPYNYSSMMNSSNSFWPNFMTSSTSYLHPTYLASSSSQNDYNDWMYQHHSTYRSPYSTTNSSSPTFSNNYLHPMGSPTNNNSARYHQHSPSDMDVVTAAAIGAAAAAQMFHHEKQSHHFDYHLGGSMMATASNPFPTQNFDLVSSANENPNNKDSTTPSVWYSNHHLFC